MNEESGTPGPIIHIRADSDSTLEDMFNVALKPQGSLLPLQVPLRMRKLPESFFRQPMHHGSPNHSRENSLDISGVAESPNTFPIHHSRAHSSPATLQQTLAVAQQQSPVSNHVRQTSYDQDLGPLPPGWEMAKTPQGQLYFMNHITKTTQWEDPRKQHYASAPPVPPAPPTPALSPAPQHGPIPQPYQSSPRSASPCHNNNASLVSLPPGWDQGETPGGEVYYINHATKKTTWFDPRIPIHHQRIPQKDSQRHNRLQRLENERRALQQRQVELKKCMEKNEQLKLVKRHNQEVLQQTQEMLMRQTLNGSSSDDQPSRNDIHNRQESADSGLGMGSNFNLGSIPEDITGMEMETDLDTTLTDRTPNPTSNNSNSTNTNNANNEQNADMDSDALIPSLTGDLGDELSNDIMQDVQSILSTNKGDNLTWL
ncbi:YAP1 [Lepeophtheirus salmonis]|uniref:YAP1 n=1 Tax=Lepeophtheirus salmonis TaxID=72036 RepID=A0A7R8CXT7_LEPSM|nr:YAP1 [Lepeophtheirus salmonis]CAF2965327.1 YAP1 [Lepeophtheirus salmonis]